MASLPLMKSEWTDENDEDCDLRSFGLSKGGTDPTVCSWAFESFSDCCSIQQLQHHHPCESEEYTTITREEQVIESTLQAQFAERTAAEMIQIVDYWNATAAQEVHHDELPEFPERNSLVLEEDEQPTLVDPSVQEMLADAVSEGRWLQSDNNAVKLDVEPLGHNEERVAHPSSPIDSVCCSTTESASDCDLSFVDDDRGIVRSVSVHKSLSVAENMHEVSTRQKMDVDRVCLSTSLMARIEENLERPREAQEPSIKPFKPCPAYSLSAMDRMDLCVRFRLHRIADFLNASLCQSLSMEWLAVWIWICKHCSWLTTRRAATFLWAMLLISVLSLRVVPPRTSHRACLVHYSSFHTSGTTYLPSVMGTPWHDKQAFSSLDDSDWLL